MDDFAAASGSRSPANLQSTGGPAAVVAGPARLLADAQDLLPEMVALRRRLHRTPEIGLLLPRTQAIVVETLQGLGLESRSGTSLSSVTALIAGDRPGPTIVLRADMDALRLREETGFDFASEADGAMHACGHDTHVSMLLGAARLLLARRDELAGTVLLMFEPGEEGYHGARSMLGEGLFALPSEYGAAAPTTAFALHIKPSYATRTINVRPGPAMAAADRINITVRGRGGHASTPHLAVDPLTIAAEIVLGLQLMVTRRVDAFDPAIVTIAHFDAGTTNNIIPETAFLDGTMRTFTEATRESVRAHVRQVAQGIAAAHGATADVEIMPGYPVTVNDPTFSGLVVDVATELLGRDAVVVLDAPDMGAEDFSYVLQRVPGAMAWLGARPAGQDVATAPMNHSNRVVYDEDAMAVGAAVHAAVALRVLGSGPEQATG